MRRRLVLSTVVVVLFVVALLGFPLAVYGSRSYHNGAQAQVDLEAKKLLGSVDLRLEQDEVVDRSRLTRLVSDNRYAVVELPDSGDVIEIGEPPESAHPISSRLESEQGTVVTVLQSREQVEADVQRFHLVVAGVSLLSVLAAVGLAFFQARRLVGPLLDLADTAERLGSGDPRPRHRRYGIPELDRVAGVLDRSAERIAEMLTAERRLAADASHQLRTPLTALSMRLEEIADTPDPAVAQEEATAALAQVERLADVVEHLLRRRPASDASTVVRVDVDEVVTQQVAEWRPAYDHAGRQVVVRGLRGAAVMANPGGLAQVVATLLENALVHGLGVVTVLVRRSGALVVVEVSDKGPGVPPELGTRVFERAVSGRASTGLGLALARELAEADGGRLELVQHRPPVFAVFLNAADGVVR